MSRPACEEFAREKKPVSRRLKSLVFIKFPFYSDLAVKGGVRLPQLPRPSPAPSLASAVGDAAPRILLLVKSPESGAVYASRLQELGASADSAEDMAAMVGLLRDNAYNGIILDVPTLIKDRSYDKRLIGELTDYFPLLRARHDTIAGRIMALSSGGATVEGDALVQFVRANCAGFAARRIRGSERVAVCLHVLAAVRGPEGSGAAEAAFLSPRRACLLDISGGGCFLWDVEPPQTDTVVRVIFHDRPAAAPVTAKVVWRLAWGERPTPPGAGMQFLSLPDDIAAWFQALGVRSP
jgi:hypothetical protein